jgi:hypothetical protein
MKFKPFFGQEEIMTLKSAKDKLQNIIEELRTKIDKNEITASEFSFLSIYNFGCSIGAYYPDGGEIILIELNDRIDDLKTPSPRLTFERGN